MTELDADGGYDLVMAFDTIHDIPQPVPVLEAMRRMAGERGTVLLFEPAFGPFTGEFGDDSTRWKHGHNVLHCLPVSMNEQPSVAAGTVLEIETMRSWAKEGGFFDIQMVPVMPEGGTNGLYRLVP